MKKIFFPFFFILFFLNSAESKELIVKAKLTSPELVKIEPGKIVTCSFLISNHSRRKEKFFEKLDIPEGWQLIVSEELPFELKPKEKQLRVMGFFVPNSCPAGRYQTTYSAGRHNNNKIADHVSFSVIVLPIIKLKILVESKPEVVVAGEPYKVKLRLINQGNSERDLKLEVKGTPDYPLKMVVSEISLKAGESVPLEINVKTDKRLKRVTNHILTVKAGTKKLKKEVVSTSTSQVLLTEIIPKITCKFDPYHRIPSQIKLISIKEESEAAFQMEFSGSGKLDEEGKTGIDFLFRGDDIHNKSIYGQRDEYYLNYYSELLDFFVGDRNYSLSPLTERYKYGRGAEINIYPADFKVGTFYVESRWEKPEEGRAGMYVEYKFNDYLNVKGNFLNKNKESYNDKISSLQTQIKPTEKLNLELEYGYCNSSREEKFTDNAYSVDFGGEVYNRVYYNLKKIYAKPNFFGYYNDIDYNSQRVVFPIYDKLSGKMSYHGYKNNLGRDVIREVAVKEESYEAGISYPVKYGMQIYLDYKDFRRKDELLPADYDYGENLLRLRLEQTFRKLSIHSYIERGRFENELIDNENNYFGRYSFYAYFRPNYKQSYSVYTRIGDDSFSGSLEKAKSTGVSGTWHINNFYFNLNYKHYKGNNIQQHNVFSKFFYTLPNKHSLSLKSHWFRYEERKEEKTSFFLVYTIPWGIPIRKKEFIGSVKGNVYDGEKGENVPIANVILRIHGAIAITDKKGRFVFPSLNPGTYFLMIDKSSVGLNRLADKKIPIKVEVKGGEVTKIKIGIVDSGTISGEVIFFDVKKKENKDLKNDVFLIGSGQSNSLQRSDKNNLKGKRALNNVLVEISNGREIVRENTNKKGEFCFKNIRPGKWTLKIYDYNLPANHYFEKNELQIELKPGEERRFVIKVLPRVRPVKIIDKGEIR